MKSGTAGVSPRAEVLIPWPWYC